MEASATDNGSAVSRSLRLFLSYSRSDAAFADELAQGLEAIGGFDVAIDREDIHEGEAWRARLGALIAAADTVVFVLSPRSATSPVCRWEAEEARRLHKRILPVLAAPLGDALAPPELAELNYVRFDPEADGRPRSFVGGLVALRRALNTDVAWLREHTRLLLRAEEWSLAGRPANRLLTGADIAAAKAWLAAPPREAPAPTELHRDFVAASDEAESLRLSEERRRADGFRRANRRLRWAIAGMAALAAAAGGSSYYAYLKTAEASDLAARLFAAQLQASSPRAGEPAAPARPPAAQQRQAPAPSRSIVGGSFLSRGSYVVAADGKSARVTSDIVFRDARGTTWSVAAGTIADGASIPFGLWSAIGSPFDEDIFRAAALHGRYAETRERTWEATSQMFYEALIASGASDVKASTMYAGLLYGGPRWPEKQ